MEEIKNQEHRVMLRLLSQALFGAPKEPLPQTLDLTALYALCRTHAVLGIVFDVLPPSAAQFAPDVYEKWQTQAFGIARRNMSYQHMDCELHRLLTSAGIPHSTIKGTAAAAVYPNPMLRQMGDIDFIVSPEDMARTHALLTQNGYAETGHSHRFHESFVKDGMTYELHFAVSLVPEGKDDVLRLVDRLIPTARTYQTDSGELLIPDAFHHGMVLLLHMQRHLSNNSGLGLRHLCDWLVFVRSMPDREFCDLFEQTLRSVGLWRFAQILSRLGCRYFAMEHRPWMGEADAETEIALMSEILDSGNFGNNDVQRAQEAFFFRRGNSRRSAFASFFAACTEKVCVWAPFYATHRWLLPVGYVAYAFRMLGLVLTGKTTLHLRTAYQKGTARNSTIDNLRLFRTDGE